MTGEAHTEELLDYLAHHPGAGASIRRERDGRWTVTLRTASNVELSTSGGQIEVCIQKVLHYTITDPHGLF